MGSLAVSNRDRFVIDGEKVGMFALRWTTSAVKPIFDPVGLLGIGRYRCRTMSLFGNSEGCISERIALMR